MTALRQKAQTAAIETIIDRAWKDRAAVGVGTGGEVRDAVQEALALLDSGQAAVAERGADGGWIVNQWLKKAVLLSFRLNPSHTMQGGYDKVEPKFAGWDDARFAEAGLRAVPGGYVRYSAYVAPNVVLMPSFINVGAHVGEGTMIDTWATVGSCARIGRNCHISGGVGIGGVLEPLQANPVIIEDQVFVGARSEVAEGVIVGTGAVIGMGVFLGASTKIVHRETGEISYGYVPPYSVVVPGSLLSATGPDGLALACAVIVKTVDEKTRSKTGINELLRL